MNLEKIMQQKVFAVVGNTIREDKYAYKIKNKLIEKGYTAYGVSKELQSLNEIEEDIDIIDLCINPILGIRFIQECTKSYKCIVIQPGAESEELLKYLRKNQIPFIEGCLLVGLSVYAR